ncbi:MAG: hypothetical protein WAL03_01045 [Pseudolabrys sp.]
MVDDRATQRKKMREQLANLRSAAMAELERRGYDVRGKTPAQIRQILKRGPSKKRIGVGRLSRQPTVTRHMI